jgi:hypothetical protein
MSRPPTKTTREYFSRIGKIGGAIGGKSRSAAKLAALRETTRARVERQRAAKAAFKNAAQAGELKSSRLD